MIKILIITKTTKWKSAIYSFTICGPIASAFWCMQHLRRKMEHFLINTYVMWSNYRETAQTFWMLKRYRKSRPKGSSSVTMKGSDAIYLRLWSERDISGSVLTEISETDWCFRLSNSSHSQRGRHYKYNNWCHESLYLDKCWKKIRVYLNQRIFIAK